MVTISIKLSPMQSSLDRMPTLQDWLLTITEKHTTADRLKLANPAQDPEWESVAHSPFGDNKKCRTALSDWIRRFWWPWVLDCHPAPQPEFWPMLPAQNCRSKMTGSDTRC